MNDFRADRVGAALAGTNPTVLRRMRAGFAVIGDVQHLPGYCVLVTDTPGADQLLDLPVEPQQVFLEDMVPSSVERWRRCARGATRRSGGSTSRSRATPTRSCTRT